MTLLVVWIILTTCQALMYIWRYRAINYIFLLEDSGNRDHIIDQQLWANIFGQLRQEYPSEELSNDSLLKCNEMAKVRFFVSVLSLCH